MDIDPKRLQKFVDTLSKDQKKLIRESLGGVSDIDPHKLAKSLSSRGGIEALQKVASSVDAGAANAGTKRPKKPPKEPPLTRW